MKRSVRVTYVALAAILLATGYTNCSSTFATKPLKAAESALGSSRRFSIIEDGNELMADPAYKAGFITIQACPDVDVNPACATSPRYRMAHPRFPELASREPVWDIAQWGSRSNLPAAASVEPGKISWGNEDKSLAIYDDGTLEMSHNAAHENGDAYQSFSLQRKWPHFLLGQTISSPGRYQRPSPWISQLSALNFNLDFKLVYHDQHIRPGYNRGPHNASFNIYYVIQNLREGSPGYGQYVWFGIVPWNDNEAFIPQMEMFDDGTQMLIYIMPTQEFTRVSSHSGQWINMSANILDHVKNAVQSAHAKGYLKSNDLNDYKVGGMNMGYEITGLNVVTSQLRNLSMKAVARPEAAGEAQAAATTRNEVLTPVRSEPVPLPQPPDVVQPPPPPTQTPPPPQPPVQTELGPVQAEGMFMNGPHLYYSNGVNAYCHIVSWDDWANLGSRAYAQVSQMPNMANHGDCGSPPEPEGFFRINNGDGIFYSNGRDAFCVFTTWERYTQWSGRSEANNLKSRQTLPRGMANHGVCGG